MGISLFEHNQKAYDSAVSLMEETGKAAVIHPTGTGKSFIGFKLAEQNPKLHICWLSPSEYIFKTQLENLKTASGGYEPTNIQFMTYAKLILVADNEIADIKPDYIILDEFHRCGAAEWGKGIKKLLNTYPATPVLGLSATHIRYLDNQRDMAIELFDGNIASEITLGEAIVRNILLPPVYVISVYSYQKELGKYQRKVNRIKNEGIREINQKKLDELRRAVEKADGLDVIFQKHIKNKRGKYIAFCANIEHMNEMVKNVPKWFSAIDSEPYVYSVYADNPSSDKAFLAFKQNDDNNHLKLLFCVDMLNEGIHVEDISGVIMLRPTVSPIIYKQQLGRALSAAKGKEPVIFDIVNNFENLYSIGGVEEEMHLAVNYYREHAGYGRIVNENFRIFDEVRDCRRLFEELQDSLSASWETNYEAAKNYYETYGHLNIPKRYKTSDKLSLGAWIVTQRRVRSGAVYGVLTDEQMRKLDAIGMIWDNRFDFQWRQGLRYAQQYYKEYGNLDIKAKYVTDDGFLLGNWITNLRHQRKKDGKNSNACSFLTKERIESLNAMGMIWDKNDWLWESNFSEAEKYFKEFGHLNVPSGYVTESGMKLGSWIFNMRGAKKGANSLKLTKKQVKRLDSIGMIWEKRYDAQWMKYYQSAKNYYEEYGNLNVPTAYTTESGLKLGVWLYNHRKVREDNQFSNLNLTEERIKLLDDIGMVWHTEDAWEKRFLLAKQYYEAHGHLNVSQSFKTKNNIWLGKWISLQRKIKRGEIKGKVLTAEQIKKLESIGMEWDFSYASQIWESNYSAAVKYYNRYGHLDVPYGYTSSSGKDLSVWIRAQRKYRYSPSYKQLTPERIKRLDSLGMIWDKSSSVSGCDVSNNSGIYAAYL